MNIYFTQAPNNKYEESTRKKKSLQKASKKKKKIYDPIEKVFSPWFLLLPSTYI